MITTTLKDIRAAGLCDTFDDLLAHLGKTRTEAKTDTTPLPVLTVLESNGIDDALWVLDYAVKDRRICRLFAADCAEKVLHIFEAERPDDDRPRRAIEVARDPSATDSERCDAGDAAWDAGAAVGATARDAARAAARAASDEAAEDVAWAAAWAAAVEAAREAQADRLRQYLIHGEAAADMPWAYEVRASR